jgi:SPP1 family predicted phage head-tail adaptor
MGYSSGILRERVTIKNKTGSAAFGDKTSYEEVATVWANVTWKKGQKSLNEGALDSVDTVLIRMRWNNIVTRDSLLLHNGTTYQIQSFHADYHENTIQITATEIV